MFRWVALVVLFGSVGISAYYRRRARLEGGTIARRQEGGAVLAARALGGLTAFAAILAHALIPAAMAWASFQSRDWVPWLGVVAGVVIVPMTYWVFSSIGRNVSETVLTKEGHELVTIGPYRWVRHPLYAVGIALFAAMGLMLRSWLVLLFAAVALVLFRFVVIPAEEQRLIEKFGDQYSTYMRRTGRFLPRVP